MKIQDLKAGLKQIKREFKFNCVKFRYHNKNLSGGNFGIDLIKGNYGDREREYYEISGNYNTQNDLFSLRIGKGFQIGSKVNPKDINDLINSIRIMILAYKQESEVKDEL
jgi:hypothetical protein